MSINEVPINQYRLEKIFNWFTVGETYKNDNNSLYKIIDISTQERIVFERVSDGYRLLAIGTQLYYRIWNDGRKERVIEWSYSKEIGWNKSPN